jgi:hypothetical protein
LLCWLDPGNRGEGDLNADPALEPRIIFALYDEAVACMLCGVLATPRGPRTLQAEKIPNIIGVQGCRPPCRSASIEILAFLLVSCALPELGFPNRVP